MATGRTATFYTVTDASFFPGTVALLNSLRLSGNREPLVALDVGLERGQRVRLARHATVVDLECELPRPLFKAFPRAFAPSGVVVVVDSGEFGIDEGFDRLPTEMFDGAGESECVLIMSWWEAEGCCGWGAQYCWSS